MGPADNCLYERRKEPETADNAEKPQAELGYQGADNTKSFIL
jgi:hypothetical protein